MSLDHNPRPNDDEAAPTASFRFSTVEPLDRLGEVALAPCSRPIPPEARSVPETSVERRRASSFGASLDKDEHLPEKITEQQEGGISVSETAKPDESVLYLAYGSNMASKTFLGVRGIKPISQIRVLIPELQLTFDLPGMPYVEPCFAATKPRDPSPIDQDIISLDDDDEIESTGAEILSEKAPLLETREIKSAGQHNHQWDKPLVGVVYEVTLADYAKIIASEGGGRGYVDVVIDCYPFAEDYKPTDPVPNSPKTEPFKAHTLLAPGVDDALMKSSSITRCTQHTPSVWWDVGLPVRPIPGYAQPTARYLNLLVSGAAEHDLPVSYQEYLSHSRTYRITTTRQKIGKALFLLLWGPFALAILRLSKSCAGPDGRNPPWLAAFANFVFVAKWKSYDCFFKLVFGDGERTMDDPPPTE